MPFESANAYATVRDFGTALLIGALLGIERERHKNSAEHQGLAGLRSFILFALLGAFGGWFTQLLASPWPLVATLLAALVLVVAGYLMQVRHAPGSIGLTTELAALTASLLGAMTMLGHREPAIGLAVAVAAILAYKQPLHGLVSRLDSEDVYAGLRLLIATFIVLPLLPNRPIDPWGVINPAALWLLVLLISGLSLVGYLATRMLGAHRGLALTGLSGGLVSSTAVTLSFARQSRLATDHAPATMLACGILLAWCVMFARVLIAVLVVNRALLGPLLWPFLAMGTVAGLSAAVYYRRARRAVSADDGPAIPLVNPFSLSSAARFAALFAVVLLLVELVRRLAPGRGEYVVAALAGLTDVDAITLSMAQYAKTGSIATAVGAIVVASLSNTIVKATMAATLGSAALRRLIVPATVAVLIGGGATLWLA